MHPPPPPFIKEGGRGIEFLKFLKKMEDSGFSHKNGVVGKLGKIIFKKKGGRQYHCFHSN